MDGNGKGDGEPEGGGRERGDKSRHPLWKVVKADGKRGHHSHLLQSILFVLRVGELVSA
jgi:hypothetical protein